MEVIRESYTPGIPDKFCKQLGKYSRTKRHIRFRHRCIYDGHRPHTPGTVYSRPVAIMQYRFHKRGYRKTLISRGIDNDHK